MCPLAFVCPTVGPNTQIGVVDGFYPLVLDAKQFGCVGKAVFHLMTKLKPRWDVHLSGDDDQLG